MIKEFRIVIIGSGGVGKSALTLQLVANQFVLDYDPTIEDAYRKQIEVDGEIVMLDLLDSAGQEDYSGMRDQYMRTGQGFLIVYSITSRASFTNAGQLRQHVSRVKDCDELPVVFVGNKTDLEDERVVSKEEGQKLAEQYHSPFFETSAKDRVNLESCFQELVREIKKNIVELPPTLRKSTGSEKDVFSSKKKPCRLL